MNISLVLYLLFIVSPISIFIHELGHATAALYNKADKVLISIGTGKELWNFQISRLEVTINFFYFIGGYTSSTRERPYQKSELIYISLLGPVFNGLVCIILLLCLLTNTTTALLFLLFNLWLAIGNLLPIRWGGKGTDGYIILSLMRK